MCAITCRHSSTSEWFEAPPGRVDRDLLDVALGRRTKQAALAWLDHDADLTAWKPLSDAMNGYRAVFDID